MKKEIEEVTVYENSLMDKILFGVILYVFVIGLFQTENFLSFDSFVGYFLIIGALIIYGYKCYYYVLFPNDNYIRISKDYFEYQSVNLKERYYWKYVKDIDLIHMPPLYQKSKSLFQRSFARIVFEPYLSFNFEEQYYQGNLEQYQKKLKNRKWGYFDFYLEKKYKMDHIKIKRLMVERMNQWRSENKDTSLI